ncbi:MAG: deoxyribose-phosphate aldolase [Bacteroidales bacterium]
MRNVFHSYQQTAENIDERINQLAGISIPLGEQKAILVKILGYLDLTTLEGADTEEKVKQLCRQARFSAAGSGFPDAAAVCVYPSLVRAAKKELQNTGIRVAAVAGGFPSGQTSLKVKLEEVKWAVGEGAGEIDTVISRGKLLEGGDTEVYEELCAIREACSDQLLKVILESGELGTIDPIRRASEIAILAGADFIKTSTGKIPVGATPEAFLIMLDTIREYREITGKAIGIKAAGGIRTPDQALLYYQLVENTLGADWLNARCFRIGASSLANEILLAV